MTKHYRWDQPLPPAPWEEKADAATLWRLKLEQALATLPGGIRLGKNLASQLPVFLDPAQLQTHMHVLGSTGGGKSFFLEGMFKNLILQGHGVGLLDPVGDLYHRLVDFCAALDRQRPELRLSERVIPIDVGNTQQVIGFNPVARNARVMTYQVVALMEAIRKCWAQTSFFDTPRLARWLFNTAYALVDTRVTFLQSYHLVSPQTNAYRDAIVSRISNPRIKAEWEWLAALKDTPREERVESTLNRIKPFIEREAVRYMLGQHTKTLDFGDVLSGRKILLVNLAKQNAISEDDQHLLGTLLVNELLTAAFARPRGQRPPFYLFLDEFQHFVTKDMCEILDGGRKFGLHLILAHQHLQQLKIKDPEVYYSTLGNARVKAIFGGLVDEDLDVVGRELFTGELDPNLVKDEIWQTKFRPVESTRVVTSTTSGSSSGAGVVDHQSLMSGSSYIPGSEFFSSGQTTRSQSSTTGSSRQSSASYSDSESRSEVPFYEFHEFRELSSRTFQALEEQLYIKKAQLKRFRRQEAAVLIPDKPVQIIRTPTIKEFTVKDSDRTAFLEACIEHAGCFKTPAEAELEQQQLEQALLTEARPAIDVRPVEPTARKRAQTRRRSPLEDVIGRE